VLVGALLVMVQPSSAAQTSPAVSLDRTSVAPGDRVLVTLTGWPPGPVALSVCGNGALRGDQDCNLRASEAVSNRTDPTLFELPIAVPPVPCPCVVRAFNAGDALVRLAPVTIAGVAVAPTVAPTVQNVRVLEVSAQVRTGHRSWLDGMRAGLGGPAPLTLVLSIRNTGSSAVDDLTMTAAVGRDDQRGEPLRLPALEPLEAGQVQQYELPFTLSAPAFGRYTVFGTVYGPGDPVTFSTRVSNSTQLLFVALAALAAVVVVYAVLRLRRRRVAAEEEEDAGQWIFVPRSAMKPSDQPSLTDEQTQHEQSFQSPSGGEVAQEAMPTVQDHGGDALSTR
jgi:hypothetical protein